MSQPIALYYWPTPNGWKISIALEEMGLPYEVKLVNIGKGEQFKPDFLAISPNNRMPAIIDPEGPNDGSGGAPLSIFESGAILQYLGRKSGKFYPADERGRVTVDQWVFWQVANLGPASGQSNHFKTYARSLTEAKHLDYAVARFGNEVDRLWGVLDRQFAAHAYVAGGDYSIADMAVWPWLNGAYTRGELGDFPRIVEYFERVGARPAVQKGKALHEELRKTPAQLASKDSEAERAVLFGQTAKSVAAHSSKS